MGKIKLTESQIVMLQSLEEQLPKKKLVKITSEQYNRLFENRIDEKFEVVAKSRDNEPVSDIMMYKTPKGFYLGRSFYSDRAKTWQPYSKDSSDFNNGKEMCAAYAKGFYNKELQEEIVKEEGEGLGVQLIGNPKELCPTNSVGESNEHEFKMPPKPMRPSTKVTNNFKSAGRSIPKANIKFEDTLRGDFKPQTEKENIKTTKSFNENKGNPASQVDIIEFGQQVIKFLKELLTDPTDEHINKFWRDRGVSKNDLTKKMFEIGMIGHNLINGKKLIKILKPNFYDNVKALYKEYVPEIAESSDKIKTNLQQQLKRKEGPKPSPESIASKIKQKRAEELKRRKSETDKPIEEDNYPMGANEDPSAPWNQKEPNPGITPQNRPLDLLWWHQENAIFEKDGKYYVFNVETVDKNEFANYASRDETPIGRDEDGMMDVEYGDWEMDSNIIDSYVNDNYANLSLGKGYSDYENGKQLVEIDQEMIDELMALVKHISDPAKKQELISTLSNLSLSETTASSSGAFVAPMGSSTTINKNDPASEMKKIVGEVEGNDSENEKLSNLKYKNFQHPALGVFIIDKVINKNDNEKTLEYSISLLREDGKISNSELLYIFNKETKKDKLIFNQESEKIRDAYSVFDELYSIVFDGLKEALKPNEVEETTTAASSGSFVQPKIWAKDKANMRFGKKTMYPKGKIVDKTIKESVNTTSTAYPEGGFVKLDDCTKLNNNKKAQNGGCSTGAVDKVVKLKQTKDSVISDDAVYYEVAKKTGRTIDEVKKIIQRKKG